MGEAALTTIQRMFSETTRDTDHCRFTKAKWPSSWPIRRVEAVEGATADESKGPRQASGRVILGELLNRSSPSRLHDEVAPALLAETGRPSLAKPSARSFRRDGSRGLKRNSSLGPQSRRERVCSCASGCIARKATSSVSRRRYRKDSAAPLT